MIRIERDTHPAAFHVIFNRIFHQIVERQGQLYLIDIRRHLPDAFKGQLHIAFPGNGAEPL